MLIRGFASRIFLPVACIFIRFRNCSNDFWPVVSPSIATRSARFGLKNAPTAAPEAKAKRSVAAILSLSKNLRAVLILYDRGKFVEKRRLRANSSLDVNLRMRRSGQVLKEAIINSIREWRKKLSWSDNSIPEWRKKLSLSDNSIHEWRHEN